MNTLQISDTALIALANHALKEMRANAEWIRLFSQPHTLRSSPAARAGIVNVCRHHAEDLRPVLKLAVKKYGAELFRRRGLKTTGGKA